MTHDANAAAAEVPQAAAFVLAHYQARNAAVARNDILNHDAAQTALITQEIHDRDTRVAAAQQVLATDQAADVLSPQFVTANPQVPESVIQIVNDYTPDVKTVVFIGAMVGVAVLVPGAGPVLLAVAAGTLVSRGVDRYFDGNQSLMQACVGATADATGISEVYQAFTNQDIATGGHMNLTVAEQRRIIGTTVLQFTVGYAAGYGSSFVRNRTTAVPTQRPTSPTSGSNAGRAGAAQAPTRPNQALMRCFPAGTPVNTVNGLQSIETIEAGNKVWAYDLVASRWRACRVMQTFSARYQGRSVFVTIAGETIEATFRHPFFVVRGENLSGRPCLEHLPEVPNNATTSGRWVDAGDLRVGDELILLDGRILPVTSVHARPYHADVYNFEVEDLHCYAVGRGGVLVHNSNGSEGAAPTTPPHAQTTLSTVRTTGQPPAGYKGGGTFANDGRGGGQVLPRATSNGTPITYREYDVNPLTKGVGRGTQRLVIGSDGRAYYTNDHYGTFTEVL